MTPFYYDQISLNRKRFKLWGSYVAGLGLNTGQTRAFHIDVHGLLRGHKCIFRVRKFLSLRNTGLETPRQAGPRFESGEVVEVRGNLGVGGCIGQGLGSK